MSALLRQLIDCLYQRDIRPTSEELADVLWLALRMDELDRANAPTTTARAETKSATQPEQPVAGQAAEPPGSKTGGPTLPAGVEQRLPVFAETAPVSALTADGITMGARSLRAPAAPALPEALALSRALRPLLRKVPSRSHFMLDESATAERYADQKLWLPIFKGQPERWLELALVVEDSPSLRVWQPTLAGLYRLLARHGAFRDVRWWWLRTDPKGRPVLGKRTADSQPRAPRELLHPEGRRLVIVVSDCASPFWYDPRFLDPLLRLWGQRQPLALLHLLPPHYWSRGGLGRANFTRFRALAPGQPNAWLVADKTGLPTRAFYLPIFTLEPESVALWAGVLAGQSRARCPGRILGNAVATLPPRDRGRIPAQQRLRDFRSNASPEAQLLLRYCATVPLTLPVMRLLQTEVLRQTQQLPLAEIFLSGLLLRKNPQETDPDRFIYDFHSDLQALLLDTLRAPQILDIHQRLSEAVRRNLGRSADFLAFIPDLLEEGGLRLDARSLPFAEVGVTVLRRLGGHYVEHAERLAREIKHITTAIAAGEHARIDERVSETMREKAEAAPSVPTPFRDSFPDGAPGPAMVWLPGGPFTMGDDKSPRDNEKPAHPVTLSHFGIGQYPVTFEEYDRFCEAMHRDKPNDQGWGRGRRPVIDVSWDDAQAYCQWLSQQTGQDYRLLTEAQWEYACRAGRDAAYCFGDDEKPLEDYAWYWKNSEGQTHPVGEKQG
ncbi:MAG: SUMF1/EgtB/PvdO family nonheme iron enzyme, partial [Candidatus Competibacteraceae bacterium]|nr:SUMF1/EgtB/PvdO family nonheme iron enzyme [Candidatus Competibacteraceae bacterium]